MATDHRTPIKPEPAPEGYEKRDASAKWIFAIIAFLFVTGLIIHFLLAGMVKRLKTNPTTTDAWSGGRPPGWLTPTPAAFPRLQISPAADLRQFREREEAELHTYGWINRTGGVVRIPIERAMDLVLQRGLPTDTGTGQRQRGPSSYQLQQRKAQSGQPEIQGEK